MNIYFSTLTGRIAIVKKILHFNDNCILLKVEKKLVCSGRHIKFSQKSQRMNKIPNILS